MSYKSRAPFVGHIREIFTMARLCHWSHSEICARLNERVFNPMSEKTNSGRHRCTAADRAYCKGVADTMLAGLWSGAVEFVYRDKSGAFYSTAKDSSFTSTDYFYERGRGNELALMECAHVWKGTNKPFTPWCFTGAAKNEGGECNV